MVSPCIVKINNHILKKLPISIKQVGMKRINRKISTVTQTKNLNVSDLMKKI